MRAKDFLLPHWTTLYLVKFNYPVMKTEVRYLSSKKLIFRSTESRIVGESLEIWRIKNLIEH